MRVLKNVYGAESCILYNVDGMEAMPVTVSNAGVTPDARGRKIVKAGTLVGGEGGSALANKSRYVTAHNDADCEGVLLYDTDVTDGPHPSGMIYKGNVNLGKIPAAPTPAAAAKLPMVRFLA
jgi:hypothetical protein